MLPQPLYHRIFLLMIRQLDIRLGAQRGEKYFSEDQAFGNHKLTPIIGYGAISFVA
jgi:hypothetical protein